MKIADLYIRVSTDEQADKGYSQRGQEEMLRRYCSMQGIQVRKTIFEDHSAKNFERPEWKKLLSDLKKHKKQIDFILFTKWDRFSRNAGDAYAMISILRGLGVDPQAIEQPLDLLIPENKMMLAFYLAAPEVENDRRALNVIYGMRRARKEGRFVNKAPVGYINRTTESGKKYIAIEPVQGPLMRRAFEEVAQGLFRPEVIFRALQQKGLKGTRNNFWFNLRNPIYCGKIWINKFRDEEEMIVQGQHEALISEELFSKVQDFLNGRIRCQPKKEEPPEFFLRGFLLCPACGKRLTGSTSRGRKKYYSYYHCYRSCNYRIDNVHANKIVRKELSKFIPFMEIGLLFSEALAYEYQQQNRDTSGAKFGLLNEIRTAEEKLRESRDWLFNGRISPEDYSELKKELTQRIEELERKLGAIPTERVDLKGLLEKGIRNLLSLDDAINQRDIGRSRVIIGSIYPEKFTIVENTVRTAKVNEAVELIYRLGKGYSRLQKTKKEAKTSLLSWVDPPGLEPGTL